MLDLKKKFLEVFGIKYEREFFSPGRVNLIGEHTDYNGGNVFPCAIDRGTYGLVKLRDDKKFRMYSENFEKNGIIEFSLDKLENEKKHGWVNYPKGIIKMFIEAGYKIDRGFDILFYGNIPNGAGLSSSASIEILTAVVLKKLFSLDIDMIEMVKLGQKTENLFIGVNSGIMDQFAVGMGKKDNAVLLDCNTLKYEYVPVLLKDEVIIISNTNKRRGLADSKYNERRSECEQALKELQEKLHIKALGELSIEEFEKNKELIKNETNRKRAKHAVYENQRTLKAQKELTKGNLEEFGKLMNESHISLRDDYEVTGKELDTLVELSWKQDGTVGSRMTGAGFGGCTVSIVKKDKAEEFIKNVGKGYRDKIGYDADFYIVEVSEGPREL
jgi:galactokinase